METEEGDSKQNMLKIVKRICVVMLLFGGTLYFLYSPSSNASTSFRDNQPEQTGMITPTTTVSPRETTTPSMTNTPVSTVTSTPKPTIIHKNMPPLTSGQAPTPTVAQIPTPTLPPGYSSTIFDDEFNGTHLDTTKWNIESQDPGGSRSCCSYHQPTYFTPQDVSAGNGNLVLETEKRNYNGYNYTTGMVQTQNKFAFQYGRIDIRAKLPGTQSIWPGFWMLPPNETKPAFEIDIMELLGKDPRTVYMTNHWDSNSNYQQCQYTGPDFTASYHVFSVIWQPGSLTWFIDGIQRCHITQGVANTSMYLLLDTCIGGKWGGSPDNTTVFPAYSSIDYVRVYQ